MTTDDDTNPGTPSGVNPNLYTISRQVAALSRQFAALREAQESALGEVQSALRVSLTPEPRPSMMRAAASKSKGVFAWLGLVTAGAQVVALFYPKLEGPIAVLLKSLAAITGAGP